MDCKGPQMSTTILKNNNTEALILPEFQTYYRAIIREYDTEIRRDV